MQNNLVLCLLLSGALLLPACGKQLDATPQNSALPPLYSQTQTIDTSLFLSDSQFKKAIHAQVQPLAHEGRWRLAVVPHHDLAAPLAAEVLAQLATEKPQTVIIWGPNHANSGAQISTTQLAYATLEGQVSVNAEISQKLLDSSLVHSDDRIFQTEHSIGALIPLIKHYLPEAQIVPLVSHYDLTVTEGTALLDLLAPYLAHDAVLVASLDFSHGLTAPAAALHNAQMLEWLAAGDSSTIACQRSEYLDAPAILATLLQYAASAEISDYQVLADTNAAEFAGAQGDNITSYLTLLYSK